MKRGGLSKILAWILYAMLLPALAACDVHEFPDEGNKDEGIEVTLHLDFNQELPPYKEIIYESGTARAPLSEQIDVRYVVNIYRAENETDEFGREPSERLVVNNSDVNTLNTDMPLTLAPGRYRFLVWTDYSEAGSPEDRYYSTADFSSIELATDEYVGNDDFRDAFRGDIEATVAEGESREITVEMSRPMAKYKFIATDYDKFVSRALTAARLELENRGENPDEVNVHPSDYTVVIRYTGFMPHVYNMFTDKPSDATVGVMFTGPLKELSATEADLGFDYVFVNGKEAIVQVACELYDKDNNRLSSSGTINVPLKRSMLTVVRGEFLSSSAGGGVGISPEFDGEYNIIVP